MKLDPYRLKALSELNPGYYFFGIGVSLYENTYGLNDLWTFYGDCNAWEELNEYENEYESGFYTFYLIGPFLDLDTMYDDIVGTIII